MSEPKYVDVELGGYERTFYNVRFTVVDGKPCWAEMLPDSDTHVRGIELNEEESLLLWEACFALNLVDEPNYE